jgi:hypothetical protein
MFEEQFAPMRRENTIARCCAQLVSSLTPGMAGLGNTFVRAWHSAHDTRRRVVRTVVAQRQVCAAGGVL